MTQKQITALTRYIDTFCTNGIFVGQMVKFGTNFKITPAAFTPYWSSKGYHLITENGAYKSPQHTDTTLSDIISEWDIAFPINTRDETKINDIKGYKDLLKFYINNLGNMDKLGYLWCTFKCTYYIASLNVFDAAHDIGVSFYSNNIPPDLFTNYELNYYKTLQKQYEDDISEF